MEHPKIALDVAELGIAYIEYYKLILKKRNRFRHWWSKPLIRYNSGYGNNNTVFRYFKLNDEKEFMKFIRMNVQIFEYLNRLIHAALIKTSKRPSLTPELRLSIALKCYRWSTWHYRIRKPPNNDSLFFNYKKFYSIVLMACCDSKMFYLGKHWIFQ